MEENKIRYFSRKLNNKGVLKTVTVMWVFKIFLITVILYAANTTAKANPSSSQDLFCNWVADAALAVAENRRNGIGEYDLIDKVLATNTNYREQIVIIPLIDRIYRSEENLSPFDHALIEYEMCDYLFTGLIEFSY